MTELGKPLEEGKSCKKYYDGKKLSMITVRRVRGKDVMKVK